jgi:ribosomal protein S18 acetylase RimI-like enzyme
LVKALQVHLLELKNWFSDFEQILTWGGPDMVYPISDKDFVELLTKPHLNSYALVDANQQLLAFGQYYIRLDRWHLGRLAVNPQFRGQGLAKVLVTELLQSAALKKSNMEASLFVFTDNHVAHQCYQSLGFIETDYPGGVPGNLQNCVYMVLSPNHSKLRLTT